MEKIFGINSDCIDGQDELLTLELIKKTGFTRTFTSECNNEKIKVYKKKADELNIIVEFLHAPFRGINAMWEDGDGYLNIYNGMIEAIDTASANDIPAVIIHTSSGWNPPEISQIGIDRYDYLLDYAIKKGVVLAFENLRSFKHVSCFVERYKDNDSVRFCYDFGHNHCYTPNDDFISLFGDKTICTHIHDNNGYIADLDGDEHLLPFDGTVNYGKIVKALDKVGYKGSLMLEVFNASKEEYKKLSAEEFVKKAYERIKRL